MKVFITGGVKNGKSTLAKNIAVKLSRDRKRYYVATMIPTDNEDLNRIQRHIRDREGLGFETIEQGLEIQNCLNLADSDGTFLVDSVTALLMNEMFPPEKGYVLDVEAVSRCMEGLRSIAERTSNAVFVSDYIYGDDTTSDTVTLTYMEGLAQIDRELARICDVVIELAAGQAVYHKGYI